MLVKYRIRTRPNQRNVTGPCVDYEYTEKIAAYTAKNEPNARNHVYFD